MTDLLYRSFEPDLEIRSARQGGDGRTVVGIAVPWATPIRVNAHLREQFASGAFDHQEKAAHRIKFSREHLKLGGALIGRVEQMRNDARGQWVQLRVSATEAGDETLELIRDGALTELSVGFYERQNRRLSDGTVERVTADMIEVAVTLQGAYGEHAEVLAVRADQQTTNLDKARQIAASLPVLPEAA